MLSANELREFVSGKSKTGFTIDEVNNAISEAADTIEAYENENKDLYHKLEVLANKIEEYRAEEDSIKTALITAQKMADRIKKDSSDEADRLISDSRQKADAGLNAAKSQAEKIINETREYSNSLINQKKQEADAIIIEAEKKSNEAINSSQVVAQNILDQAKEISNELVKKSQEEKEAYEQLNSALRRNAAVFIDNLKNLYSEQLDALNSAKLFSEKAPDDEELNSIKDEVTSLIGEIDDMKNAIPKEVKIEKTQIPEQPEENKADEAKPVEKAGSSAKEDDAPAQEKADPMAAVEAFSTDEITPIDKSKPVVNEIQDEPEEEEKSLFDEKMPFEDYFHVNNEDAHLDKTQTISLISPEEENAESQNSKPEEPKKRGLFKKKK